MRTQTRDRVWHILYDYAVSQLPKLTKWPLADIKRAYPFHRLLFSDKAVLAARIERSVVTTMGDALYPSLAKAIGEDQYTEVLTEHLVEGVVNDAACNMIEQIVTETPHAKETANHTEGTGSWSRAEGRAEFTWGWADVPCDNSRSVYWGTLQVGPLFIELKSPLPNLDVAAESKRSSYITSLYGKKGCP